MRWTKAAWWTAGVLVPVTLLAVWELADRYALLPPSLSAAPSDIVLRCVELVASGTLIKHAMYSLLRIIASVLLGTAFGIASGLLVAHMRWADRLFSPFLRMVAPVPVVVWMPFVVMAVGAGELYKITLATVAGFLIIHMHTYQGVRSVHRDYLELAQIYEKTFAEKVRHVLLPAASPSIFTGLRLTLAIAWIVIFFVEFASARQGSEGLGWFIADARAVGRVEDEYAGVLLLALTGWLSDWLVARLQRKYLDWTDTLESIAARPDL